MIRFSLNGKDYLLIEVPKDAHSFTKTDFKTHSVLNYKRVFTGNRNWGVNDGEYNTLLLNANILNKISEILENEKMCSKIVESYSNRTFKHYSVDNEKYGNKFAMEFIFDNAKGSFKSFLQSINLNFDKEWLLIELLS